MRFANLFAIAPGLLLWTFGAPCVAGSGNDGGPAPIVSDEYPYIEVGDGTLAKVDLSIQRGAPRYLASGMLNGIPENYPNQVPNEWFTGIKLQYARDGGGQDGEPNRGWLYGFDEYRGRLDLVLNVYKQMRHIGGKFILMGSDIWGASPEHNEFPGDNGSYEEYDKFWSQLLDDLVEQDVLEGLEIDIWNEPDIQGTWNRTLQQFIDFYNHIYTLTKADDRFKNVPLQAPSAAAYPENNSTWWPMWLDQVAGNGTAPDIYSYHLLKNSRPYIRDPEITNATLAAMLADRNMPANLVNVNEYGNNAQQTPSGFTFYISRFERHDMVGCMAVYNKPLPLHDYLDSLLTKSSDISNPNNTDYIAAAPWPVFNYYAEKMTGQRVWTTGSTNLEFDAYATYDSTNGKLAILAGTDMITGNYSISVQNIDVITGQDSGSINVTTSVYTGSDNHTAPAPPVDERGSKAYEYTNGTLNINVDQTDEHAAWTFELDLSSIGSA